MLAKPGEMRSTYILNAKFCLLEQAPFLKNRQKIKVFMGTSVTCAMIVMIDREEMKPGETGLVRFRLEDKLPALPRDPFVAALMNVPRVIGGGKVLEIPRSKYRESRAGKIMPYLNSLQGKNIAGIIDAIMNMAPDRPLDPAMLSHTTGLPTNAFELEMQSRIAKGELIQIGGYGLFDKARYDRHKLLVKETIKNILKSDPLKEDIKSGEIIDKLSLSLKPGLVRNMLDELSSEGNLIYSDGGYRVSDMAVSLSESQREIITFLRGFAQDAGVVPFSAYTVWKKCRNSCSLNQVEKLLDYLFHHCQLVRLKNRRFLSLQGPEEIKNRVRNAILHKGSIHITDIPRRCCACFCFPNITGREILGVI